MARVTHPPKTTIDLKDARRALAGVRIRALDVDWLAVDDAGHVAVFLGDHASPIPARTDPAWTATVLETIAHSISQRIAASTTALGYRTHASPVDPPIFDTPRTAPAEPLHERPFEGYPHLVIATVEGAEVVRSLTAELGGREVQARHGHAAVLDVLGHISYEELHEGKACAGCRVVDNPEDPRPRAPETLATAGLYVYGHAPVERGEWVRIASPSRPIHRNDIAAIADPTSKVAPFNDRFEDADWISSR